jgi:hypothetical protein
MAPLEAQHIYQLRRIDSEAEGALLSSHSPVTVQSQEVERVQLRSHNTLLVLTNVNRTSAPTSARIGLRMGQPNSSSAGETTVRPRNELVTLCFAEAPPDTVG